MAETRDDFRRLALALPLSVEQPHFGAPSFRADGKIFAQLSADEASGLVKLDPGRQEWAVGTYPACCGVELHWGRHGWTRMRLAALPADLIGDLLKASWRAVAPRKLHALLLGPTGP